MQRVLLGQIKPGYYIITLCWFLLRMDFEINGVVVFDQAIADGKGSKISLQGIMQIH
jgi:hypothetical protein